MLLKNQAIQVLKDYVKHNDLIQDYNTHIYTEMVQEYKYCWLIPWCSNIYHKTQHQGYILVGQGPYLIDKENEKIYKTGSAPIDWIKKFNDFKEGKTKEKWTPCKNNYLEVKYKEIPKDQFSYYYIKCKYENISSCIQKEIRSIYNTEGINASPRVYRKSYNEFETTLKFCYKSNRLGILEKQVVLGSTSTISIEFVKKDSLNVFPSPNIHTLKNWLKINTKFKSTDNYWQEVDYGNIRNSFSEWTVKLYMEIEQKSK